MPTDVITHELPVYRWHCLSLPLAPLRAIGNSTPALVVLNALLKSVKPVSQPIQPVKLAFHVPDRPAHKLKLRKEAPFSLRIASFGADTQWIEAWLAALRQHLQSRSAGFVLVEDPLWSERQWQWPDVHEHSEKAETGLCATHAELEFLSPLPFKRPRGANRTHLDKITFFQQLVQRIRQLFGEHVPLPDLTQINWQSHHWHYTELPQPSRSQAGHTRYFNGCSGSLYLSGALGTVLPWLQLAAEIHAGGSLALNPLGYCKLHVPARPALDTRLQTAETWHSALLDVIDTHDDWEQQLATEHGAPFDAKSYLDDLRATVLSQAWQPAPSLSFSVPKRQGARQLEKLPPAESLLHTLLHELLRLPIDRTLEAAAVGYRRGHSVQSATRRVRDLLSKGYRYVVESDIEDFFPDIDLERLLSLLDHVLPPADQLLRQLLSKLLYASYLQNGRIHPRQSGLAQGSPLSPLFANLYLDRFDEAFNTHDTHLVRYADDFIILARTHERAKALLDLARAELGHIGLAIAESKTAIHSVEDGFRFLGQPFGGIAENTVAEILIPPARKTVYITETGCFLGHNGDALEIRRAGNLLETIPLRRVADITVLAPASFSSGLVQRCARLGIPLTFTLGSGYHIASLPPDSRRYHTIVTAQTLHYTRLSEQERLILAKGFASGKVANYRPLIEARHAPGNAALLGRLNECLDGIEQATTVSAVRGHEGRAARLMFATLNSYLKVAAFHFDKRRRERPDRMNVLFNFGYYLLFSRLNTLVRAAGLNPYLGFLHDGEDDYETLVCDIEELFRAPLDRHLVALVNLRVIQADDFEQESKKGLRLKRLAIRRFLEHFERLLHSDAGGISFLQAMEAQVQAFVRYIREDSPLWYFNYRRGLEKDTQFTAHSSKDKP